MKQILSLILILALATGLSAQKQPNVLIILSDDQGWGDVGFNGCTDIPTPNLDQLASEGVVFTQAYASHPYCSPSRAGLLSGRYQQRFGHENNLPYTTAKVDDGLPLDELMLSEYLQDKGYHTCAIGKWHLGDSIAYWPNQRGFDDWYGFFGGGMSYWGDTGRKSAEHGVLRDGKVVPKSEITYLTDDFSNEAVKYIDKYSKTKKPFFMYLAYNAPHSPVHATSEYVSRVQHIEDGKRAAYAAMVTGMDAGIGKVIDKLKKTGEYENTLIVFYSDNGGTDQGAINVPFRGHKGMLFEGGIRIPFCMTWPGMIPAEQMYEHPIIALDIFPTVLAAAKLKTPKKKTLDGVDLLPYLNGKKSTLPHDDLYFRYSDGAGYAVRKGKYKMVKSHYKEDHFFLFDMEADPYEHKDLSAQMPEKLDELKNLYANWNAGTVPSKWQDPHAENIAKEEARRQKFLDAATRGEKKK